MPYYAGQQKIDLDDPVGKGGEGEVFSLKNRPDQVFKKYHEKHLTPEKRQKISAMIKKQFGASSANVAFPIEIVMLNKKSFAGFVMQYVSGFKPLHELYAPRARKQNFPNKDFRFLVRTALNIARAVSQVHQAGCVIGDINHSGILISDNAIANVIDADSFQFSDGTKDYYCAVGVPEYTPPELQGQNLSNIKRSKTHDGFGLGVIIFQLLFMGRHPFSGRFQGTGEMPLDKAIKQHRFAYSLKRNTQMKIPPAICSLGIFPLEIQTLFEYCFNKDVKQRPSAQDWVVALTKLESDLRRCSASARHFFPSTASSCPWCAMEAATGSLLFETVIKKSHLVAIKFSEPNDIKAALQQINKLKLPAKVKFSPALPANLKSIKADMKVIGEKRGSAATSLVSGAALIAAGIGIIYLTDFALFMLGAPIAIWGGIMAYKATFSSKEHFEEEHRKALGEVQSRINQGAHAINTNVTSTLSSLKGFAQDYSNLKTSFSNLETDYRAIRKEVHLEHFLSGKLIKNASIPQVRRESIDNLISYGIESAVDVKAQFNTLQSVPSIGPVRHQRLLEWLNKIERSFSFENSSKFTNTDIGLVNKKKSELLKQRDELFIEMKSGLKLFKSEYKLLQKSASQTDPTLLTAYRNLHQAEANLKEFGISKKQSTSEKFVSLSPRKPHVRIKTNAWEAYKQRIVRHSPTQLPTKPSYPRSNRSTTKSKTNCPQCGSSMVRRTARRGYNAGGQFWGCSNYPSCKGTRR